MPKTRAQKSETVEKLTEAFKKGKSAMFSDYQGMTVTGVTALRKKLHAENVDYIVAKKSLLSLAAKNAGYDVNFKSMPGMLGVAFANEDEMAGAKLIGDAGKNAPIKLVGGLFEGKFVDQAYVTTLSKLPSKAQLLGQLLSVFNGPAAAFARVLNANVEKAKV
ncbi:50S ribosomal protein L10 [Candidatus Uhrbacteria bacterium]|nr:50S ribosomal protein L10 [Candidatus Uhrbacteria bacterium]